MSTEDDICLWCQDSLAEHGLVIELTTEDFKQMFKHDASCKIIHYACFKDYQKKRAKDSLENEQKRASEQTERPSLPPDRSRWFRVLFAALSNQTAEIRLAAPAWPGPLPDLPYFCALQVHIASPVWQGPEIYHPYLCSLPRGRTMFRPMGPEHYFLDNSPSSIRAPVPFPQQFEMPMSQPSFQPRLSSQPLVQPDRILPPHVYNRFTPYTDSQCYFSGNSHQMAENSMYFPEQQGLPPNTCNPRQLSPAGTYNSYSAVTHTRSIPGYQSVYQERTQCHWSAQSHNSIFG